MYDILWVQVHYLVGMHFFCLGGGGWGKALRGVLYEYCTYLVASHKAETVPRMEKLDEVEPNGRGICQEWCKAFRILVSLALVSLAKLGYIYPVRDWGISYT